MGHLRCPLHARGAHLALSLAIRAGPSSCPGVQRAQSRLPAGSLAKGGSACRGAHTLGAGLSPIHSLLQRAPSFRVNIKPYFKKSKQSHFLPECQSQAGTNPFQMLPCSLWWGRPTHRSCVVTPPTKCHVWGNCCEPAPDVWTTAAQLGEAFPACSGPPRRRRDREAAALCGEAPAGGVSWVLKACRQPMPLEECHP